MRISIVTFIIVAASALSQAASIPSVEVGDNDTLLPRALAESVDKREAGQVQAFARGFVAMSQRRHARSHPGIITHRTIGRI
ncbi:hypothetical protein M378DRAFT_161677 [Amanita muscaria Koide BX008]|uniref:RxLR effector protein n=1 Tax=Amanita muscaria (strain Koide BX008) TaxID=946122 RepID=A0A0C2TFQ4_AMAMK|nr:hypothetical protein M378DRAFT_161677 [Amanita muscaria Koide BX008]